MLMMKIKLFSNKKLMFYKILLLKQTKGDIYYEKFLALIFASTLILGACGTKDVEERKEKERS